MPIHIWLISAALLAWGAGTAVGQQAKPNTDSAPIVQPGAPGQSSRMLTPATAYTPPRAPIAADISFMQGMIMHHSQAVEMVALLRTRGQSKELRSLADRIRISQTDEIKYMKQWLEDRGQPTEMGMGDMAGMSADDMKHMSGMPLMPGMLTPEQMDALTKASGHNFDHLFLTGMIQHHTGALTMVDELFNTAGAGQDNVLFDFATDVDNTQRAEIRIMQGMLSREKR
jgi:uncharacterized protein (DUF305 family)